MVSNICMRFRTAFSENSLLICSHHYAIVQLKFQDIFSWTVVPCRRALYPKPVLAHASAGTCALVTENVRQFLYLLYLASSWRRSCSTCNDSLASQNKRERTFLAHLEQAQWSNRNKKLRIHCACAAGWPGIIRNNSYLAGHAPSPVSAHPH
jgi:hypothetical protein